MVRKLRLLVFFLIIYLSFTFTSSNFSVNAETIHNVWSLLQIKDETRHFTDEEIAEITKNYMAIEQNNLYAQLAEELAQSGVNSEIDLKKAELVNRMEQARNELQSAFTECKTVDEVFKIKSEIENITAEMYKMKQEGVEIEYTFQDNTYAFDYQQIQNFKNDQYDIGTVGTGIKPPTDSAFELLRLQGNCIDWFDTTKVVYHTGIDIKANPGEAVYAQFNGVIRNIYYNYYDGNCIELQCGSHLLVRYKNVGVVDVVKGTEVSQYDRIGTVGLSGANALEPHLHIEMFLDNIAINPVLLYGTTGIRAVQRWYVKNPNTLIDISELLKQFDTTVQKEKIEEPYHDFYDAPDKIDQAIIDKAIEEGYYPEGYKDTTTGLNKGVPNDLQKLIDKLEGGQSNDKEEASKSDD